MRLVFQKVLNTKHDNAMTFQRVVEESYRDGGFARNSQEWELPRNLNKIPYTGEENIYMKIKLSHEMFHFDL